MTETSSSLATIDYYLINLSHYCDAICINGEPLSEECETYVQDISWAYNRALYWVRNAVRDTLGR